MSCGIVFFPLRVRMMRGAVRMLSRGDRPETTG